jgi:peptide/nickel transport system permease protein
MAVFLARRLLLAAGVLIGVSFASFTLIATKFSATCTSQYTPATKYPPLASNVHQAAVLYWRWLRDVPSGRAFQESCGPGFLSPFWTSVEHTAVLLALTALMVVVISLLVGTLAAVNAGSAFDVVFRVFAYAAWAVPSFVLALIFQSIIEWATSQHGFRLFPASGWPGICPSTLFFTPPSCPHPTGVRYSLSVLQHTFVPALTLSLAFIGLHSRYLRSALLVSLRAPYTTTAYAKGLTQRRVVIRHALRNSLATFTSALLLDMGAIFGAAMAVDWVFRLGGFGMLFIIQINGIGGGDSPAFLNPYAVENLLAFAALFVLGSAFVSELAVGLLDPRARLR